MKVEHPNTAVQDHWDPESAEAWHLDRTADARPLGLFPEHYIPTVKQFLLGLREKGDIILLHDRVVDAVEEFVQASEATDPECTKRLLKTFRGCQEIFFTTSYIYAHLRPRVGQIQMVRLHPEAQQFEEVSRFIYLQEKDSYIQGVEEAYKGGLTLDFSPFFQNYPKVREAKSMGEGISVLNRHLAGVMHQNTPRFRQAMAKFLADFHLEGHNLLCNEHLESPETLAKELVRAEDMLADYADDTPYSEISHDLRILGFEAGWGAHVAEIRDGLDILGKVMDAADPDRLERLLAKLPLTRSVLMVSPHGWFAQEKVLGKPDTGGQVTYVLDQARAIECAMKARFEACGIDVNPHVVILTRLIPNAEDTTCNVPRERVVGSNYSWIIRVPFRHSDGSIHENWISRFHLWPYLEQFALDARRAVITEFMGTPGLVVGHYTDGNLVAHRLSADLGITHCAAVHALEKTKYLLSDIYWADMEQEYHFSCHFTADVIAYNSADFIISSSYREIGGTPTEMGMFETYETFSMPGLFRVTSGMDPTLARYNIVPPGVSDEHFYPASETERRSATVAKKLEDILFSSEPAPGDVGHLTHPERPPVFAMSRMDKVKNLPGLVEAFAKDAALRESANLVIMSSLTNADDSQDQEEIEQIGRLYDIIAEYKLEGCFRWCAARLDKTSTGEIYRVMADRRGVFAQPAFMETFGLTVIEAMACCLPVVVTCFGGPAEIVIHGDSGEQVNPNEHEKMSDALRRVVCDAALWDKYSARGIARVREAFNWNAHANKVLRLANTYSFWDHFDALNRKALDQYIHTLYHTVYRPRAMAILDEQ